jgi:hypothetical protein
MNDGDKLPQSISSKSPDRAHRVRLPGFLIEDEIGLGDVIKRATAAVGIRPCGGCEERATGLNRWMHFTNRGER